MHITKIKLYYEVALSIIYRRLVIFLISSWFFTAFCDRCSAIIGLNLLLLHLTRETKLINSLVVDLVDPALVQKYEEHNICNGQKLYRRLNTKSQFNGTEQNKVEVNFFNIYVYVNCVKYKLREISRMHENSPKDAQPGF